MFHSLTKSLSARKQRKEDRRTRLFLETLEDRLTPSWAGVPPTLITVPTNFTSVTLNSQGDAGGAAAISTRENDFYRLRTTVSGTYTFTATATSGTLDTVIGVFSSTGSRLGFNDDIVPFENTDSRLTLTLTAGRTYYFGVTSYTGSPGGNYNWGIDGPALAVDDAFEDNDTIGVASNLGTISQAQTFNNLAMQDAHDYYRFVIGAGTGGSAVINFTHSQGDLDLELLNGNGDLVLRSEGTANSEQVSLGGLAAGTYYVHVYGYQGARNPNYSLTITPPTAVPPPPPDDGGGTSNFTITLRLTGMSASQQRIFQQAAARWSQIIVGDLPNATFNGIAVDDVLIDGSGASIDGPGGVLGQAGPDSFRSGSRLPIHGSMQFDTADLAQLESSGQLFSVILHEMGHVLGIGTIWNSKGLLSGASTTNPRFTGAQATAEYNRIFGTTATSVPVEGGGGAGTRNSHFRESVLGNELMTGFLNSGPNPLSRITAASLADLGYQVNLSAADAYSPPSATLRSGGGSGGGSGSALRAGEGFGSGCCCGVCARAANPFVRSTPTTPVVVARDPFTRPALDGHFSLVASSSRGATGELAPTNNPTRPSSAAASSATVFSAAADETDGLDLSPSRQDERDEGAAAPTDSWWIQHATEDGAFSL